MTGDESFFDRMRLCMKEVEMRLWRSRYDTYRNLGSFDKKFCEDCAI